MYKFRAELSNMQNWQAAVLTDFGTGGVVPKVGSTMAGISSGRMREPGESGWAAPAIGTSFGNLGSPPAGYQLLDSLDCNNNICPAGSGANLTKN